MGNISNIEKMGTVPREPSSHPEMIYSSGSTTWEIYGDCPLI
jgi:hypothetical protein